MGNWICSSMWKAPIWSPFCTTREPRFNGVRDKLMLPTNNHQTLPMHGSYTNMTCPCEKCQQARKARTVLALASLRPTRGKQRQVRWKQLVWANLFALGLNGLFLVLAFVKVCPFLIPLLLFALFLFGLVLLSCKANGRTIRRKQR